MSEICERRVRHLKRLQADHNREFWARFGNQNVEADSKVIHLTDAIAADWNRKRKAAAKSSAAASPTTGARELPRGWRCEHWKTQQAMAFDYAGVRASNKAEAVAALQAYEGEPDLPPAA